MIKEISSAQNPLIKKLILFQQKPRARKKEGVFIIEGIREVERAARSGYVLEQLLFNEFWEHSEMNDYVQSVESKTLLSNTVFSKVAYRDGVKNVLALAQEREVDIRDLTLGDSPLIMVLERVEKPGNLGAILRSADAAGVAAVLVCDEQVDIYNPNVIRNSLGGFFNVPVCKMVSSDAIAYLKEDNFQIFTTYLEASKPYYEMDMTKAIALVVGSEAEGVTDIWLENATQNIIIPMAGIVDSLNVSSAASIVMFEAKRQRSV